MKVLLQLGLGLTLLATQYAPGTAAPGSQCRRKCGDVDIPYPFSIDPGCSLSRDFDIDCKVVQDVINKPFKNTLEVLNISLTNGTVRVLNNIKGYCYNPSTMSMDVLGMDVNEVSPTSSYRLSDVHNKFMVIGCSALAFMYDIGSTDGSTEYQSFDLARCHNLSDLVDGSCSGIGCSQTTIPKKMHYYYIKFFESMNTSRIWAFNRCSYAVLMEAA